MTTQKKNSPERIHWQFHPRVFSSLGAELVTNDFVALVELVKNAYDAFAHRVDIRFVEDSGGLRLDIQDDGHGMDSVTIREAWCTVGTPFKVAKPSVGRGKQSRRVTGEKGLGRLSAARLGSKLRILTKARGEPCYQIDIDWNAMSRASRLNDCPVELREVTKPAILTNQGTLLQISNLERPWDFSNSDRSALRSHLARFVPPFKKQAEFEIYLSFPGEGEQPVKVKPQRILLHPPYRLKGEVSSTGVASIFYEHKGDERERNFKKSIKLEKESPTPEQTAEAEPLGPFFRSPCGPFKFEVRLWDFDKDSLLELDKRFDLNKKVNAIRREISQSPFSGISLYRVLPKGFKHEDEKASPGRDWLGLDLRRVSRVGKRISANQIIGYVDITADNNPNLKDTADREALVDNPASQQFRRFLFQIIEFLEQQREEDRISPGHNEPPLQDLFASLRAPTLPNRIKEIAERKGSMDEVREVVDEHTRELHAAVGEIQQRFYYYSRLATVGSMAMLLQHEVGNKVSVIWELVNSLITYLKNLKPPSFLTKKLELATNATRALQRLADTFSPLASRSFGTRRRNSIVEEVAQNIKEWHEKEIQNANISFEVKSSGNTKVAVDPGELTPILDNLITNSIYWLMQSPPEGRRILLEVSSNARTDRAEFRFHDTGPGVDDGMEEKVFWPGVTKKKDGIGMGLTVASEIVAQYGGKMFLLKPGDLEGASLGFDLPLTGRRHA
jgi:signal transduction histidine kinase